MTASLLDAITEAGLTDRTVLDVGCGIGDLAIEVVARGAASGTGYDLSPKAIEEARRLAAARGVGDRMHFEVGDGAKLDLPAADIVVINRVVCCYPDTENLLDHTLGAARSVFAITAPVSRGPTGWWNRLWSALENVGYRLRPTKYGGFRVFIHDLDRIDERIRAAGFRGCGTSTVASSGTSPSTRADASRTRAAEQRADLVLRAGRRARGRAPASSSLNRS